MIMLHEFHSGHQHYPGQKKQHRPKSLFLVRLLVQFGDQIAGRDINETAGRKRQENTGDAFDPGSEIRTDQSAQYRRCRGQEIKKQGLHLAPTPIQQHAEIAELLGYLVENERHCRDYPEFDADREPGSDYKSVDKIMDRVADQIKVGESVDLAFTGMAVPPEEILFHYEESREADDREQEHLVGFSAFLDRFGKQMQKSAADQTAGTESYQ